MTTPEQLTAMLDSLEDRLPGMLADYRTEGEFWMVFVGEADVIEDQAGEHAAMVQDRIATMLAQHGYYLASVDIE